MQFTLHLSMFTPLLCLDWLTFRGRSLSVRRWPIRFQLSKILRGCRSTRLFLLLYSLRWVS